MLPPGLTEKPVTNLDYKIQEDAWEVEGADRQISRVDVARFLLKVVKGHDHKNKIVSIGIKN